ncbi:PadR family transcriptional regulator [Paenibacillus kobensis]|uniref:PadR family transcriptional regulator n=1 Tax=Paenibacillus kobensis TaxID=59841 RepID=UPI0013E40538|nr:PadR family transcriptional regulator [Paenibacillus kobensis]
MNTLAYGILSLLTNKTYSGYELTQHIQPFWPAKHSQIYPLLASLEQSGYVSFELVVQHDKPDKKIYAITENGSAKLAEWLALPAGDPATRDELAFKAYCLHKFANSADARKLFEQRAAVSRNKLEFLKAKKAEVRAREGWPSDRPTIDSPHFGAYILIDKGQRMFEAELEWCEWVLSQLPEA